MQDRRINQSLAYHVRTAVPHMDKRREYMADQRIKRILPRIFYTPVDDWGQRIAWPWVKTQLARIRAGLGS